MIPICLVTGFLGSGKTTFLRHLAERFRGRRLVYLVNEFSSLDVDGMLMEQVAEDVVAIPGGSIFCRCLVSEFIAHLAGLGDRFGEVEGVVIEASGIADPRVMQQLLADSGLEQVYLLASIVTVVDPGSFGKLLHTLPNLRAQVEAADLVLLNKTDLVSPEQVAETERMVLQISARARVVRTVYSRADLELFGAPPRRGLRGACAPCRDPNYGTREVELPGPVDLGRLLGELTRVREEIYRAKGFALTVDGMYYLDLSPAGLTTQRMDRPGLQAGLAFITRGEQCPQVERLVAALEAGEMSPDLQASS